MKYTVISNPTIKVYDSPEEVVLYHERTIFPSNDVIRAGRAMSRYQPVEFERETIKARKFYRMTKDGMETFLIGFDRKICQALEMLPTGEYKAYESLEIGHRKLKEEHRNLKEKVDRFQKMNLWKRLKWAFTGGSIKK